MTRTSCGSWQKRKRRDGIVSFALRGARVKWQIETRRNILPLYTIHIYRYIKYKNDVPISHFSFHRRLVWYHLGVPFSPPALLFPKYVYEVRTHFYSGSFPWSLKVSYFKKSRATTAKYRKSEGGRHRRDKCARDLSCVRASESEGENFCRLFYFCRHF